MPKLLVASIQVFTAYLLLLVPYVCGSRRTSNETGITQSDILNAAAPLNSLQHEYYNTWMATLRGAAMEWLDLREKRRRLWEVPPKDDVPPMGDGDDWVGAPTDGDEKDEADDVMFKERVSGGRLTMEALRMEHMQRIQERIRRNSHARRLLHLDGHRQAAHATLARHRAEGLLRPSWTSRVAGYVLRVCDVVAFVVVIVVPIRMLWALREQRRTGRRPPLLTHRD